MITSARHRHLRIAAPTMLAALLLQAIAGGAAGVCLEMSAPESSDATGIVHIGPLGNGHQGIARLIDSSSEESDAELCGCPSSEPSESDRDPAGACTMAMHCASSVAVVSVAELLPDPARRARAPATPKWSPHSVVLSHPTPPPRA